MRREVATAIAPCIMRREGILRRTDLFFGGNALVAAARNSAPGVLALEILAFAKYFEVGLSDALEIGLITEAESTDLTLFFEVLLRGSAGDLFPAEWEIGLANWEKGFPA